jgi:hypothetical protein
MLRRSKDPQDKTTKLLSISSTFVLSEIEGVVVRNAADGKKGNHLMFSQGGHLLPNLSESSRYFGGHWTSTAPVA